MNTDFVILNIYFIPSMQFVCSDESEQCKHGDINWSCTVE